MGCNAGFYGRRLRRCGWSVTGMDLDIRQATLWESDQPSGVEFIQGDIGRWDMPYAELAVAACVLYWLDEKTLERMVEGMRHRIASVIVMSRRASHPSHHSNGTLRWMRTVFRLWEPGEVIEHGHHYATIFRNRKIRSIRTRDLARMSYRSNRFRRTFSDLVERVKAGKSFAPEDTPYYRYLCSVASSWRFERTVGLIRSVLKGGVTTPVRICNGRILDGDHRVFLAQRFGIGYLLAEDVTVA